MILENITLGKKLKIGGGAVVFTVAPLNYTAVGISAKIIQQED